MSRFLFICVMLTWTGQVAAEESKEKKDVFAELDARIEKQISSDDWHVASKSFIRTQWEEYKRAHEKPGQRGEFYGASCYGGFLCDPVIDELRQYASDYNYKPSPNTELSPGPHVQIVVSPENRVFVVQDGDRIPAVVNNGIIFFTTGTLEKHNAQFGSKPYARLEMEMVYKARHFGYVIGPTDSYTDDMLRLIKLDKESPAAAKKVSGTK